MGGVANVRPVPMEPIAGPEQKPHVIGVLTFEAVGDMEPYAEALTNALRERYRAAGYTVAAPKDLTEIKLIFCDGIEGPACMTRGGKTFGADQLIYGNVRPDGRGGRILAAIILDVEKATIERSLDIPLPPDDSDAERVVFGRLTEPPPAASSPDSPASVDTYVAPAPAITEDPPRSASVPFRAPMWIALGGTVGAAAIGGFFFFRGEQKEREWNDLFGDLRNNGEVTRNGNGYRFTHQTSERLYRQRLENLEEDAERNSTIGIIGLGIGAAAAVATGVFYYLGRHKVRLQVESHEGGTRGGSFVFSW